jgi:hypothetical protein
MKRIIMMLTVALVMVAMVVATAMPAFAEKPFAGQSGHFKHQSNPCQGSDGKAPKCPGSDNSYH